MPNVSHVPRPQNPFILYRSWLKTIGAVPTAADLKKYRTASKWAGEKWNAEDKQTKLIFYDRAKEEKRQHALKYPNYVYQPRRNIRRKEKGKEEPIRTLKLNTKGKRVKKEKRNNMPALATFPVPVVLSSIFQSPICEDDIMLPATPFVLAMAKPLEFKHVTDRSSDVQGTYLISLSQYPSGATAHPIAYTQLDGQIVQDPSFSLTCTVWFYLSCFSLTNDNLQKQNDDNSMLMSALHDIVNLNYGHFDIEGAGDDLSTSFNGEIYPQGTPNEAIEKDAYEDFMKGPGSNNFEYSVTCPFPVYDWNGEDAADILGVPTAGFNRFTSMPFDDLPFT
ncbi:Sporulation minus regulator 2 [Termitomyces sp. J132]|nr:Sporulation minus regulator 2 [Termitomyces sp. J132]